MYCNIIISVVILLYYLNMSEVIVMFVLVGFGVLLSIIILWQLLILGRKNSEIDELSSMLLGKEREVNFLRSNNLDKIKECYENTKLLLELKDNKIKTLQFKIDSLEKLCRNNNNGYFEQLTPKDIKLIKQYLHPDKHNGKSSEIYTKVVGLLSKDG